MKKETRKDYGYLILASAVYGTAQLDPVLPVLCVLATLPAYLQLREGTDPGIRLFAARWGIFYGAALLAGILWRFLMPPPVSSGTLMVGQVAALQAASLIAAVMLWYRPGLSARSFPLRLLAWLTVALSINVPLNPAALAAFWAFCLLTFLGTVSDTLRPPSTAPASSRKSRAVLTGGILAVVLGLAFVFSQLFIITDQTFQHLMAYASSRFDSDHFLSMDSSVNLNGPGPSGFDIRPVMEIEKRAADRLYLLTQIFENYNNGWWTTASSKEYQLLSPDLSAATDTLRLVMYTSLANIIPAPKGVVAARGPGYYLRDQDGIVTAGRFLPAREMIVGILDEASPDTLAGAALQRNLSVPPGLKSRLRPITEGVTGQTTDPWLITERLRDFFKEEFQYSLDANFRADDRGLIRMLVERRPAYCTYFASAMILMLRTSGIPARMATGFLVQEPLPSNPDRLLARVRDGHAWVEAYLPLQNGNGRKWFGIDPTPSDARAEDLLRHNRLADNIADWFWRTQHRARAKAVSLPPEAGIAALLILPAGFLIVWWVRSRPRRKDPKKTRESASRTLPKTTTTEPVFHRFASLLRFRYGIRVKDTQTCEELIRLLERETSVKEGDLASIRAFVRDYENTRFGHGRDEKLEEHLDSLEL